MYCDYGAVPTNDARQKAAKKDGRTGGPWLGQRLFRLERQDKKGKLLYSEDFQWDSGSQWPSWTPDYPQYPRYYPGLLWHDETYDNLYHNRSSFTWEGSDLKSIANPLDETTNVTYSTPGRIHTIEGPAIGSSTPPRGFKQYWYDADYRLIKSEVDPVSPDKKKPNGDNYDQRPNAFDITTTCGYDTYGNVNSIVGPYGNGECTPNEVHFDYDPDFHDLPVYSEDKRFRDGKSMYTYAGYDDLGCKLWETLPRMASSDPLAEQTWEYDSLGRCTRAWHSGQLDSTDANLCHTDSWTKYDSENRARSQTDENEFETTLAYDEFGGKKTVAHVLNGVWQYTDYARDEVGRLKSVQVRTATIPARTIVSYTYDDLDRPLTVTSHGVTTTYSYTPQRYVAGKLMYTMVTTRTVTGGTTTKTYTDPSGRVVKEDCSKPGCPTLSVAFNYYPDGLLESAYDWTVTGGPAREYLYDTAARMTDEICHDISRRFHYEYNSAGTRKLMQIRDLSNNVLESYSYGYYPDNSLEYVEDPDGQRTTYYYDFRGRLKRTVLPNGTYTAYDYDDQLSANSGFNSATNLLARITHGVDGGAISYQAWYTYDYVGNLLSANEDTASVTYAYDEFYRLQSETRGGHYYGYRYDIYGNMIAKLVDTATTTTYHYNTDNRLTDFVTGTPPNTVTTSFGYDADGNTVTRTATGSQPTRYDYDALGNLVKVTLPNGSYHEYVYDSDGDRIQRKLNGQVAAKYIYAGNALLQELNPAGQVVTWYNPGISQTQVGSDEKRFFHYDRLGSTVRLSTPDAGFTTDSLSYDAWGNQLSGSGGPTSTRFTFVGKDGYYSDPDTGLMKLGCRYYDPTIGRFITQDPDHDGLNWYAYADNNPVMKTDPTGQAAQEFGQEEFQAYNRLTGAGGFLRALKSIFSRRANNATNADQRRIGNSKYAFKDPPGIMVAREGWKYASSLMMVVSVAGMTGDMLEVASTAKASNYRAAYKAFWKLSLRSDEEVHHIIPQMYREMVAKYGVNIDDPRLCYHLLSDVHRDVTADWTKFNVANPSATAAEVLDYATTTITKYHLYGPR